MSNLRNGLFHHVHAALLNAWALDDAPYLSDSDELIDAILPLVEQYVAEKLAEQRNGIEMAIRRKNWEESYDKPQPVTRAYALGDAAMIVNNFGRESL